MLRTVRLNLKEDDRDYHLFVITKKSNDEVRTIVDNIINSLNNEEISLYQAREHIQLQLGEDVSESSFKKFNFIVDFEHEENQEQSSQTQPNNQEVKQQ